MSWGHGLYAHRGAVAFVPVGRIDLDQIVCVEAERTVGRDNVVTSDQLALQTARTPYLRRGRCLSRYDAAGPPLRAA